MAFRFNAKKKLSKNAGWEENTRRASGANQAANFPIINNYQSAIFRRSLGSSRVWILPLRFGFFRGIVYFTEHSKNAGLERGSGLWGVISVRLCEEEFRSSDDFVFEFSDFLWSEFKLSGKCVSGHFLF